MSIRNSFEYKMAIDQAKERDGHQCVICGSWKDIQGHHVVPVRVNPGRACDPSNIISVCPKCHKAKDEECDERFGRGRGR